MVIFETALRYIPRRSRLHEHLATALAIVGGSRDWASAYAALEAALGTFGHCRIYFELGCQINSVRFAQNTGHGIGLQVSQGLDTDSFGATAGAILGARFGPSGLADEWVRPFRDDLRTSVAGFAERSLTAIARRMAALPSIGDHGSGRPAFAGDP
jgi:ADP-ribosylglycohydrolase